MSVGLVRAASSSGTSPVSVLREALPRQETRKLIPDSSATTPECAARSRAALVELVAAAAAAPGHAGEPAVPPPPALSRLLNQAGFDATAVATAASSMDGIRLGHAFVVVRCEGEELIVELSLRDQFSVAHPSQAYTAYLAQRVPQLFVGSPTQLASIVAAAAQQMALSFVEAGMSTPPWRTEKALLSKWELDVPRRAAAAAATPRAPKRVAFQPGTPPRANELFEGLQVPSSRAGVRTALSCLVGGAPAPATNFATRVTWYNPAGRVATAPSVKRMSSC